jgi:conjugative relaxase-like TrwC/TraI family protein
MMSIGRVRSRGALKYYERGDVGEEQSATKWLGRGAEALQPRDGQPWFEVVPRVLAETQQSEFSGWDLTFSAPKSVAVLWAAASEEARRKIESAMWRSVEFAVRFLEDNCHLARSGHAGGQHQRAGMVVGAVMHTANRRGEPLLHVHALAANAAFRDSGLFTALHSRDLYRAKMACGALFRCELAHLLQSELGVELRATEGRTFEVAGISDEVVRRFSTRSADIQHAVSGRPWEKSAKARELAALTTREEKVELSRETLDARWAEEMKTLGRDAPTRLEALSAGEPKKQWKVPSLVQLVAACWQGRSHLVKHLGHFSRFDLVRAVASYVEATGLGAAAVLQGVEKSIEHGWLVSLGERGQPRWTTAAVLQEEEKLLRRAARLAGSPGACIEEGKTEAFLAQGSVCARLSEEQRQAIEKLAGGPALQLLCGVAGSGKTLLLKALAELWRDHGLQPVFCAPTHKAVREMEAATGIQGTTAAAILRGRGVELGPQSILVVDEAAMLGTPDALQLLKKVVVAGAKTILVGDPNQLQSIERGGAFSALWRRYGGAELTESRRQREGWLREVVQCAADGSIETALRLLQRRDRLLDVVDERDAITAAAAVWMRQRTEDLADTMVIATSRREVTDLNRAIQAARVEAGELDPMRSAAGVGERLIVGDRVVITKTARDKSYRNGELGTVVAVDGHGILMDRDYSVLASERDVVRVPFLQDGEVAVQLGYAVTAYKAQGSTAETVIAVAQADQAANATYVQLSRARSEAWMVLSHQPGDRLPDLVEAMSRKAVKTLAIETPIRSIEFEHEM